MAKHGYHLLLFFILFFFFTVGCYSAFTKEQPHGQTITRKLKGTGFLYFDDSDNEGSSDSTSVDSGYDGDNEGTSDSSDGTSEDESGYQDYGPFYDLILSYRKKLDLIKQLCEDAPCYKKDDTACYTSKVASIPAHQCSPCDVDAQRCTYRQPTLDPAEELESYLNSLQIST